MSDYEDLRSVPMSQGTCAGIAVTPQGTYQASYGVKDAQNVRLYV